MLDMIGVGPFITLPLILAAMGGPQAMLGWILGAVLALCDGLVWAELGASMPHAGGTYHYLRTIYPGTPGRFLAFLFLFQLCFSAPLSMASGAIGLGQYATYLVPSLGAGGASRMMHLSSFAVGISVNWAIAVAIGAIVLALLLMYRSLARIETISITMGLVVLATIAWILVTGVLHANWHQAFLLPPGAFKLTPAFFAGLGSAMLIATYDYWGYYNVAFLGGEVRDPAKTIPRAILISIALVAAIYLAMNVMVLAVVPWQTMLEQQDLNSRRAVISLFMEIAYGPRLGPMMGKIAAMLIIFTAFAGISSLLLGYSRIPYAAALEGGFFRIFAKVDSSREVPYVSLLTLATVAAMFSFFQLKDVIAALVVLRILLQFLMQHVGILYLRRSQPQMERPFRMWFYPLPAAAAIIGFAYVLFSRANFLRELLIAGMIALFGTIFFVAHTLAARDRIHKVPPNVS